MTVNTTDFYNWQAAPAAALKLFNKNSPNLVLIKGHVLGKFGGADLGMYGVRDIHGGTSYSSHAFGAAWDWSYRGLYDNKNVQAGKDVAKLVSQYLIDNSEELGIQAIHDYISCRIWRANRATDANQGWKVQAKDGNGMGQAWGNWLHIEVTRNDWWLNTPIEQRFPAAPTPEPTPPPVVVPQRPTLFLNMPRNDLVTALQDFLRDKCSQDIGNSDGLFGLRTLKGYQNFRSVVAAQGHPITLDDRVDGVDWDFLAIYDGGWSRWYNAGFPQA